MFSSCSKLRVKEKEKRHDAENTRINLWACIILIVFIIMLEAGLSSSSTDNGSRELISEDSGKDELSPSSKPHVVCREDVENLAKSLRELNARRFRARWILKIDFPAGEVEAQVSQTTSHGTTISAR
ncbi:hypothetical protein HN011_001248 [Eciton burchellii]|nr:hypothetical protein HN011_001248 [Eciton burchellii]